MNRACRHTLSRHHPRRRVIQYSRESAVQSRSCGVLDTPLSRGMTVLENAQVPERIGLEVTHPPFDGFCVDQNSRRPLEEMDDSLPLFETKFRGCIIDTGNIDATLYPS